MNHKSKVQSHPGENVGNVYKNTGENDKKLGIDINTGIVQNYWLRPAEIGSHDKHDTHFLLFYQVSNLN
jgi:hypothetical protein